MRATTRGTARVIAAWAIAATLGALTGCAKTQHNEHSGPPTVVASTDVWGSIAATVAANDARVRSIISSGSADPHSYEPSPSDAAAVADASIVVYNGGGYDPWVDSILRNHHDVTAVDAYSLLDPTTVGEPLPANEHVFYELGTAKAVAGAIAAKLAEADPDKADQYRSRATEFERRADAVRTAQTELGRIRPGAAVIATEPVAHYLLHAAGLVDKTPHGFTAAVEHDADPAPADVAAVLDLIKGGTVAVVVFNDQTVTEVTRRVREAAKTAGVPVVSVTETLPAGADYLSWQSETVNRLAAALREGR